MLKLFRFRMASLPCALMGAALVFSFMLTRPDIALASGPWQSGGPSKGSIISLALQIIDLFIFFAGLVLGLGVAGSFVTGQISTTLGNPSGVSSAWTRAIGTTVAFLGVIATIPIANAVIATLAKSIGGIAGTSALTQQANDAYGWVVFLASVILAVSFAGIMLREQLAIATGSARAIADLWSRLIALVAGFLLILAAPQIASALRIVFGS